MLERALRWRCTKSWVEAVQSAGKKVFTHFNLGIRWFLIVRYPAFNSSTKAGDRGIAEVGKLGSTMTGPGRAFWRCRRGKLRLVSVDHLERRCDSNRGGHVGDYNYITG